MEEEGAALTWERATYGFSHAEVGGQRRGVPALGAQADVAGAVAALA